jgi:hypothetical protein
VAASTPFLIPIFLGGGTVFNVGSGWILQQYFRLERRHAVDIEMEEFFQHMLFPLGESDILALL